MSHQRQQHPPSLDGGTSDSLSGRSSGSGGFSLNHPIDHYNQIISTITSHDPDCALHGNNAVNRRSFKVKTSTFISNDQPALAAASAVIVQQKQRRMSPDSVINKSSFGSHHARTPSDPLPGPIYAQIKRGSSGHWRNRSTDATNAAAAANGNTNISSNSNSRTPPLSNSKPSSTKKSTPVTTRTSPHHHYSHGHYSDSGTPPMPLYNSLNRNGKPLVPTKIKTNGSLLMMNKTSPTNSSSSSSCSSSMRANPASSSLYSSLQRPRVPPPPPPPHRVRTTPISGSIDPCPIPDHRIASNEFRLISSNGHSHESLDMDSLPSLGSDDMNDGYSHHRSSIPVPVPPPRKVSTGNFTSMREEGKKHSSCISISLSLFRFMLLLFPLSILFCVTDA